MYKRVTFPYALIGISLCIIIGCSSSPRYKSGRGYCRPSFETVKKKNKESVQDDHGLRGIASYYGADFHGKQTASGEVYNMHDFTAAHGTLPFNTRVKVTNVQNNKSVIVRINDRGPFKKGRVIDVSLAAAKKIDLVGTGTAEVVLQIVE